MSDSVSISSVRAVFDSCFHVRGRIWFPSYWGTHKSWSLKPSQRERSDHPTNAASQPPTKEQMKMGQWASWVWKPTEGDLWLKTATVWGSWGNRDPTCLIVKLSGGVIKKVAPIDSVMRWIGGRSGMSENSMESQWDQTEFIIMYARRENLHSFSAHGCVLIS